MLSLTLADFFSILLASLDNSGRQEDEQLLLCDSLGLLLEEPSQNRHAREIGDTGHVVALRIDKDSADYHGLAVADIDLGIGFFAIDAWASGIASCTD